LAEWQLSRRDQNRPCDPPEKAYHRATDRRNYLIACVSGAGKTVVCTELQRRGYQAIHGDRELVYRVDPENGSAGGSGNGCTDGRRNILAPHWDGRESTSLRRQPGGEVDLDTMNRRIDERVALDPTDWGGKPEKRELAVRLHQTKEVIPKNGTIIDATDRSRASLM
jgi:hypothetical protein